MKPIMSKYSPSPTMGYYKPGSYGTLTNLKRVWWNNGGNWYILKDSLIYLYNDEHNIKRSGQESIKTSIQGHKYFPKDYKWLWCYDQILMSSTWLSHGHWGDFITQ